MLNSYINKISHNSHDFGVGVTLPTILINYNNNKKNVSIGLQYIHNQIFKRNLYDLKTKKIIGVIQYEEVIFDIKKCNNPIKYKIYLLDE